MDISQTVIQVVILDIDILNIYSYPAIPHQSKQQNINIKLGGSVTYVTILGTLTNYKFSSSAICSAMLATDVSVSCLAPS